MPSHAARICSKTAAQRWAHPEGEHGIAHRQRPVGRANRRRCRHAHERQTSAVPTISNQPELRIRSGLRGSFAAAPAWAGWNGTRRAVVSPGQAASARARIAQTSGIARKLLQSFWAPLFSVRNSRMRIWTASRTDRNAARFSSTVPSTVAGSGKLQ